MDFLDQAKRDDVARKTGILDRSKSVTKGLFVKRQHDDINIVPAMRRTSARIRTAVLEGLAEVAGQYSELLPVLRDSSARDLDVLVRRAMGSPRSDSISTTPWSLRGCRESSPRTISAMAWRTLSLLTDSPSFVV